MVTNPPKLSKFVLQEERGSEQDRFDINSLSNTYLVGRGIIISPLFEPRSPERHLTFTLVTGELATILYANTEERHSTVLCSASWELPL